MSTEVAKQTTVVSLLSQDAIKNRFEQILGKKSAGFISSIISATKANPALAKCDPQSIISSAVIAATLDLPVQQSLGFAYIIPYGTQAQFVMGYRSYIQLAQRSGQYKTIHTTEVYEGELISENKFTGEFVFDSAQRKSDKVIGYAAYFKLLNGFEKTLYMPVDNMEKHAKRYSQMYKSGKGKWKEDFDAMAKKTVIKLLLSKYGIMTVDMQTAIITDQSVVKDADTLDVDYVDNGNETDTVVVDEVTERIQKMIKKADTVEDLKKLEEHLPESLFDLYNDRMNKIVELSQAKKEGKLL